MTGRMTVSHLTVLSILLEERQPLWLSEIGEAWSEKLGRPPDFSLLKRTVADLMDQRLLRIHRQAVKFRGPKTPQYIITQQGIDAMTDIVTKLRMMPELPRYFDFDPDELRFPTETDA